MVRLKEPIPRSDELLDRVQTALTPNRRPVLVAIDGADGIGKSSLASWLAWQTGMPTVHLDLFLTCVQPIQWLTASRACWSWTLSVKLHAHEYLVTHTSANGLLARFS
jgi:chloramphenicol 3-O-phosphotransferase